MLILAGKFVQRWRLVSASDPFGNRDWNKKIKKKKEKKEKESIILV